MMSKHWTWFVVILLAWVTFDSLSDYLYSRRQQVSRAAIMFNQGTILSNQAVIINLLVSNQAPAVVRKP